MVNNLGINTVHIDANQLNNLGLSRMEMGLGRAGSYEERLEKLKKDIECARVMQVPYSIHLPIVIPEGFEKDYLDVFFLDPDPMLREMSFEMLEANLRAVAPMGSDYCVLHFAGVYKESSPGFLNFEAVLDEALIRIDALAEKYKVRILLEYMGSNFRFSRYMDWIQKISPFKHIGILTDTGHLYFSSIIHGFDFMTALDALASRSDAFHLWTTRGEGAYDQSECYRAYHHIMLSLDQKPEDGWAFDTQAVMKRLMIEKKPMIIEAFIKYKGMDYFYDGIASLVSMN